MLTKLGLKKQIPHLSILLTATLTLLIAGESAMACSAERSGPMPICGGLMIAPETDVIVIESHNTGGLTNVLLGPELHSAEYINVVIGDVPRPVTLVVSHYNAAVLNFSGNVDQVDQVIAMGARRLGWDHVATTGIDVRKVSFLPVIGQNRNLITSCSAPPSSCVPEQYFDLIGEGRRWLGDVPFDPQYIRMKPTMYIGALRQALVNIPEEPEQITASQVEEFRWPQNWHEEVVLYNKSKEDLATYTRGQLASPTSLTLNPNLPSWAGILGLIEEGTIRPADDYDTDPDLRRFSQAFNERYRTRFDPDFSFEPHIDFVLRHNFRGELPRDLQKADNTPVIFLRTYGPAPIQNEGDTGRYCFFSPNDLLAQPRSTNSPRQGEWRSQCRPHALGGPSGLSPTLASLQLDAANSLENHKQWETQLCPLIDIPPDAEVVVLSTQHGRLGDGIRFKHCDIETSLQSVSSGSPTEILGEGADQCEPGEVDVLIDRSGPMFLFLKGRGALKWNFEVSSESEIVGVVTVNDRRQSIAGLPEGVPFNQYVPGDRSLPDGCGNALLNASPVAGGPAIQLFEMMLNQTSGRDIDLLFNNGVSTDQESQTPEYIRDYTTFVVR